MKKFKTILAGFLVGAFALFTFNASAGNHPLEEWEHTYPDASKALGKWVKKNKDAAQVIFQWDADHPERSQEMVNWAIEHTGEHLHKFVKQHKEWPELIDIENSHKSAFEDFLEWCRNNSEAAKDLMSHSQGLQWAGDHIYKKDYKEMEKAK